eukprot:TRINITY_DN8957_c0_g5_i1.p1 TRINITY_DN8957_c0_g5~~TRINITY_DN8957_c0_g5_i1.p1  ORF type:complete len:650 (+),score=107.14 TRINITY_DN8957_c0_g5_i1:70-2019(+)
MQKWIINLVRCGCVLATYAVPKNESSTLTESLLLSSPTNLINSSLTLSVGDVTNVTETGVVNEGMVNTSTSIISNTTITTYYPIEDETSNATSSYTQVENNTKTESIQQLSKTEYVVNSSFVTTTWSDTSIKSKTETVIKTDTASEEVTVPTVTTMTVSDVVDDDNPTMSVPIEPDDEPTPTITSHILMPSSPPAPPQTGQPQITDSPPTTVPVEINFQTSSISIGAVTLFKYEVACDLMLQSLRSEISQQEGLDVTGVTLKYGCLAEIGNPNVECHSEKTIVDYGCPQDEDIKGGLIEIEGKCFLENCHTVITFVVQFEGGDDILELYHLVQAFASDEDTAFRAMFPLASASPSTTSQPTQVPIQSTQVPTDEPSAVHTEEPTPEPTVEKSSSDYSSVTLWLGIAGIGGVLALGSLLIIRLTNRGRTSKNAVQLINENCELHPVVNRNGRSSNDVKFAKDTSPSLACNAWSSPNQKQQQQPQPQPQQQVSFVNGDMTGGASPVPLSPLTDKPHSKMITGGLHIEGKESRRYNSVQESWESLNPLAHPDLTTVADPFLVEDQAVVSLIEALESKGISVSHLSTQEVVDRAINLLHCRSNPLRFCPNCTKGTHGVTYSISCACQRVSYCSDSCRQKHWVYHKAECVKYAS